MRTRSVCIIPASIKAGSLPRDRAAEKAKLGISGPLILSVGALIPRKGQDLLIAALPSAA